MIWPFRIKHPAALVEAHDTIDRLTKDVTYWQGRALTAGRLSSEVMREPEEARAIIAKAHVRGPKGHFQRAELPRQDDTAVSNG